MQTLKTAAIVVLLMTVMYGAYVSLTDPARTVARWRRRDAGDQRRRDICHRCRFAARTRVSWKSTLARQIAGLDAADSNGLGSLDLPSDGSIATTNPSESIDSSASAG